MSKSKGQQQQDRCALLDLTNDSPIVGLANGGNPETPMAKQRGSIVKNTPASGEALLRGQVKTLLHKVEEEEARQIHNFSGRGTTGLASITPSAVVNQEDCESEKSLITRSLLLDFSDKSQVSDVSEECFSEVSSCSVKKPSIAIEDDDASVWSMQVNASTYDEDDEEEEIAEDEEDYYEDVDEDEEEEDEFEEGGLLLDEVCEGLNNISVNERIVTKFEGKHTRFVYNSDDELVKEEEEDENSAQSASPNILHLKGLPTPKGKHLRFSEEEEQKEEGKSAL